MSVRVVGALFAVVASLAAINGCSTAEPQSGGVVTASSSASKTTSPTPSSAATAPWVAPIDGTWQYGHIGFQQPFKGTYSDWQVRVQGLPQFEGAYDGQATVIGSFLVERVEDHGNPSSASKDNDFYFLPGNDSHIDDESYGSQTVLACDRDQVPKGESTLCHASFRAPTAEMQNFYWLMDGQVTAAWPSQVPND